MTILEMMERANTRDTNLAIAWIKDAIHAMESTYSENLKVDKQDIVKSADGDDNQYNLPPGLISIYSVSVLDTEDGDKYKIIRRMVGDTIISEDTSP